MKLKLNRPIVFFDLETTGTNISSDRIVEISLIKLHPDGRVLEKTRRVNPEMHIPESATAIHHIVISIYIPPSTLTLFIKTAHYFSFFLFLFK